MAQKKNQKKKQETIADNTPRRHKETGQKRTSGLGHATTSGD